MDRNAIITLAIGHLDFWQKTHPIMQQYADRIGADFVKITAIQQPNNIFEGHKLAKFQLYDYLSTYRRICFLDGDIVVHPDCPNLFDLVPEDRLGVVYESKPYFNRDEVFQWACDFYGAPYPGDANEWFNTGMMVISRQHQNIFIAPNNVKNFTARNADGSIAEGFNWLDMPLLNCLSRIQGIKLQNLGFKFNYLQPLKYFSNCPFEPEDSFIFHGCGEDKSYIDKIIRHWYGEAPPSM
ncbi:MAG: glycosyltransferase [Thermosynechococcaceae cyanobacterium]